jgi:hypothetical protein
MVGEWPVIMWYMRAMRDQSTPTALAYELIGKVPGQMVPLLQDLYNAKDTSVIPFYATTQQGCYLPSVTEHYFEVLARGCNLPSMASLKVDVYNVTITTQEDVLRLCCLNNLKAVWPQMDLSRDLKGHVHDYLKELVEMDTAVHSYKFFTCCCSAVTTELRSNSLAVQLMTFCHPTSHIVVDIPSNHIEQADGWHLHLNGHRVAVACTYVHNMSVLHLTTHKGLIESEACDHGIDFSRVDFATLTWSVKNIAFPKMINIYSISANILLSNGALMRLFSDVRLCGITCAALTTT